MERHECHTFLTLSLWKTAWYYLLKLKCTSLSLRNFTCENMHQETGTAMLIVQTLYVWAPSGKNQDLQLYLEGQIDRLIQWANITQKNNNIATHINMDGFRKHNVEEKKRVISMWKISWSFEVFFFFFLTSLNYTGDGCMANKTTRKIKGMMTIIIDWRKKETCGLADAQRRLLGFWEC